MTTSRDDDRLAEIRANVEAWGLLMRNWRGWESAKTDVVYLLGRVTEAEQRIAERCWCGEDEDAVVHDLDALRRTTDGGNSYHQSMSWRERAEAAERRAEDSEESCAYWQSCFTTALAQRNEAEQQLQALRRELAEAVLRGDLFKRALEEAAPLKEESK